MLFTTIEFAMLVAIAFSIFYLVRGVFAQVGILLIASIVFYAFSSPWLTLLLLASAIFTSWSSYEINQADTAKKRKIIACVGVMLNIFVLVFFKYAGLLVRSLENLTGASLSGAEWLVMLPLPIGISFYTFQRISMLIDTFRDSRNSQEASEVYRSGQSLGESLYYGSFYVIFFPQLVAGPVVKAKDFFPQIKVKSISQINWRLVTHSLVVGFFLKLVIANLSASIAEFWRRWHISLSSWLKDYLYIPLGGNRKGSFRTYLHLLIVMVLGGLWHGAAWSYLIWGAYHGLLLGVERATGLASARKGMVPGMLGTWTRYVVIFLLVSLGWSFFKLPDITHAGLFISQAFTAWESSVAQKKEVIVVATYCLPVLLYHLNYKLKFTKTRPYLVPVAYGVMLYAIVVNGASADAFIYFQF